MLNEVVTDVKVGSKSPIRSCVACRLKSDKKDLLRFVYTIDRKIVCDIRKKIQSRGIYTCINKSCIEKAIKKKYFSKFLNSNGVEPNFNELIEPLIKGYENYITSLINILNKGGNIKKGNSAILDEFDKGEIYLILISNKAGMNTKNKFIELSIKNNISYIEVDEKFLSFNKENCDLYAVEAITDKNFANKINKLLHDYTIFKKW